MAVCGKSGKRSCCFLSFPQTLEIARRPRRERKLIASDFHIPSAPATTARLIQNQTRKEPAPFAYPSLPSGSFFDWKRLLFSFSLNIVGENMPIIRNHGSAARRTYSVRARRWPNRGPGH
jgi:hypothetical protein